MSGAIPGSLQYANMCPVSYPASPHSSIANCPPACLTGQNSSVPYHPAGLAAPSALLPTRSPPPSDADSTCSAVSSAPLSGPSAAPSADAGSRPSPDLCFITSALSLSGSRLRTDHLADRLGCETNCLIWLPRQRCRRTAAGRCARVSLQRDRGTAKCLIAGCGSFYQHRCKTKFNYFSMSCTICPPTEAGRDTAERE